MYGCMFVFVSNERKERKEIQMKIEKKERVEKKKKQDKEEEFRVQEKNNKHTQQTTNNKKEFRSYVPTIGIPIRWI